LTDNRQGPRLTAADAERKVAVTLAAVRAGVLASTT
jgi:hypothetical protein